MSRLNGSTEPNTTSILVEGIPFTTIPKNNVKDEISAPWNQDLTHAAQLQESHIGSDRLDPTNEVSSHITAMESAKA